ncbi:hypothetical protein ASD89_24575 [Caulobacter sp. Root656]|nr:hypothetical protein ASD89_24575 [Caulobacter sp. Root656]
MKPLHLIRTSWGRLTSGLLAMLALCWLNGAKFTGVIDWEPTLTFVSLALAWLYSCLPDEAKVQPEISPAQIVEGNAQPSEPERKVSAHDRALFEKFKAVFDDNLLSFLREHDMGGAFDMASIEGLREVSAAWKGASYRFDDPDLAVHFEELIADVRRFTNQVALSTHQMGSSTFAKIGWNHANEDASRKVQANLNELADAVYAKADAFVILGRRALS